MSLVVGRSRFRLGVLIEDKLEEMRLIAGCSGLRFFLKCRGSVGLLSRDKELIFPIIRFRTP